MADNSLEKWDIYAVLVDYADGIDRRDMKRVGSCFTPNATAVYSGMSVGPGREAIVAFLTENLTSIASTHFVGNVQVDLADDGTARSDSFVMATHVVEADGAVRVRLRGLRYRDTFVRIDGRWCIANRVHIPVWATEADGELL
jgi:uncharacterized protein (TIGR02246 family)